MEKNFVAKIMANIRNFERNIRKAQRLAKTGVPREVSTDVDANINKFRRALNRAKAMTKRFRRHEVKFDADTGEVLSAIARTKMALATLTNKHIKLKVSTKGLTTSQIAIKAMQQGLDDFQENVDNLASRIRSFGTVFSQTFKGLMVASVQGLIPVIAGLVPALFAVLNALKVVSGGAVALGGALALAFAGGASYIGMAVSAIKMLDDGTLQATKHTEAYESALEGVKNQWAEIIKQNADSIFQSMANGLNAIKSAMKSTQPFFAGIAKGAEQASKSLLKWTQTSKVAKSFFNMLNTTGVSVFNKLLSAAGNFGDGLINMFTQLAPLFQWSADYMEKLGKSFSNWAKSASGQNAIKQFMEYTKENLPIIGRIFGNVFGAIGNLMKAFGQNSTDIFKALEQMTKKFNEWSKSIGESEGFKKFVEYMEENAPVIMSLIGNIVRALVAFGTAMAPVASAILKVVTAFVGWTATLMENHPWVAKLIGVTVMLLGAMWSLIVPLTAVNSVLGLFGGSVGKVLLSFLRLIKNAGLVGTAFKILKGVFTAFTKPVGLLMRLFPLLGTAIGAISAPVWAIIGVIALLVGAIVLLWNKNEAFRNFMTNAWNTLKDTVGGAIQGIIDWLTQLWDNISQTLQPIMPLLEQLGQLFIQGLGSAVMQAVTIAMLAFQTLWAVISVVFQTVGMVISVFVQLVVGLFTALAQFLTGDFSGAWETLQNMITNINNTIRDYLINVWNTIKGWLNNCLETIKNYFQTQWENMSSTVRNKVQNIWNTITSKFSALVGTIAGFVSKWVGKVANGFSQMVSKAISGMAQFARNIWNGFVTVVSHVAEGCSNAVAKVGEFFSNMYDAGVQLIRNFIDGIKGMIGNVVSAAADIGRSAWNAVKGAFGGGGGGGGAGAGIGQQISDSIANYHSQAVRNAGMLARDIDRELNSGLTIGTGSNFDRGIDRTIDGDVRHSMIENNAPQVNLQVNNDLDLDVLKSWIDDQDGRSMRLSY